jgi:hypothetical protein
MNLSSSKNKVKDRDELPVLVGRGFGVCVLEDDISPYLTTRQGARTI